MSFLRKRSRSQSSGDITLDAVGKHGKDLTELTLVERRYSGVSEMSSRPDDYGVHDSCVIKNFPKHKSSHLRFLAWVAYIRKYEDYSITNDERRTCPLLWCREIFEDQESMLKHVWGCEHLSKGLYWCFHCQKPERVGQFRCRRCQGLPSKTERLSTVAKRIFSKLGNKHPKHDYPLPSFTVASVTNMRLSKAAESRTTEGLRDAEETYEHEDFPPYEPLPELPNNCISEMENTSVIPEMDSSWSFSPQNLQKSTYEDEAPKQLSVFSSNLNLDISKPDFSGSYPPWSPSSITQISTQKSLARSVPTLALNTRDIYHPPSSRHRNGHIGPLSDEPMSATVISPLSASEGFFPGTVGLPGREVDVSPTESEATCNSLFTADSGYSSATIDSAMSATSMTFDSIWDKIDAKNSDPWVFPCASSTNMQIRAGLMGTPSQPASATSSTVPSRSSSNSSNHSANRCDAPHKRKAISPHWTDSKSLVEAFVDVLSEHLRHSREALEQLPSNSTIKELLAMSSTSIISIGFDALRGLLEKRSPTAILSIFAFCHVAYAAAITLDDRTSKVRTDEWFQDSLVWLSGLPSERQRMSYSLIVTAIWKPQELVHMGDFADLHEITEKQQPHVSGENKLVAACKHFLDIQQSLSDIEYPSTVYVPSSETFNFSRASFHRTAKTRIIDELIQQTSIEAFIEDVVAVEKRLREGLIPNLRQLELELICAGKVASQSEVAYERFLIHVACLCDTLYLEGESEKCRRTYHLEAIDATKALIPEEDAGEEGNEDEKFDFERFMNHHMEFGSASEAGEAFDRDVIGILDGSNFTDPITTSVDSGPLARSHSNPPPSTNPFRQSHLPSPSSSAVPLSSPFSPPRASFSGSAPLDVQNTLSSSVISVEKYKCHCGYVPQGEEKWKPSNLARHKRTQHPVQVKIYKCRFLGCASTFTRSDNLRSHEREKKHSEVDQDSREAKRQCKRRKVEDNGKQPASRTNKDG